MTKKTQNIGAIKNQLLKIAQDIENPIESAAPEQGTPEDVMELIDDAIKVLDVAQETIPAEKPEDEKSPVSPAVGAKKGQKSAQDEEDDKDKDDKKGARKRIRGAQDEEEEDEEKKELNARIANLEKELANRQREAIAREYSDLYPEDQREAKFAEIMDEDKEDDEKDDNETLEAKLKAAKEIVEVTKPSPQYRPAKNESGYLGITRKARLENSVPAWRFQKLAFGARVAGTTTRSNPSVEYLPLAAESIARGVVCYTNDAGFITIATSGASAKRPKFVTVEAVDNSAGSAGDVAVGVVGQGQYVTVETTTALSPGDPVKVTSNGKVGLLVVGSDDINLKVGTYLRKEGGTIAKNSTTPYTEEFTDDGDYKPADAAANDIVEIRIEVQK